MRQLSVRCLSVKDLTRIETKMIGTRESDDELARLLDGVSERYVAGL